MKVFLINGAVMGGGAGLSMNAKFRIITENTVRFEDVQLIFFIALKLLGYMFLAKCRHYQVSSIKGYIQSLLER